MPRRKGYYAKHRLTTKKGWSEDWDARREQRTTELAAEREAIIASSGWLRVNNEEMITVVDGRVKAHITVFAGGAWIGRVDDRQLTDKLGLPDLVAANSDLREVLSDLKGYRVCQGDRGDFRHLPMTRSEGYVDGTVVRHNNCAVVIAGNRRCIPCTRFRDSLRKRSHRARLSHTSITPPAPDAPPTPLDTPPATHPNTETTDTDNSLQQPPSALPETITAPLLNSAAATHQTTDKPASSGSPDTWPPRAELLWKEQQLARTRGKGHKWHPMMLRWAMALKHKSASCYKYLRQSGFLLAPCEDTLRSYIPYDEAKCGVDTDAMNKLAAKLTSQGVPKDIVLAFDEMKVKEGMVYDRSTGALSGYVELDGVGEATMETREEASHVICFMARSTRSHESMPVAHYATKSLTADQLYHLFWGVVAQLELRGLRVRVAVCDGAAVNRRFIDLHKEDYGDEVTFRAQNIYAEDGRAIYFASDVPHLVKTTRNCWENSGWNKGSRNLVVSFSLCI